MESDPRRPGDDRPLHHDERLALTLTPAENKPFRWLPRQGDPYCIGEWTSQRLVTFFAWLPAYIGLIVTLILIVQVFHPFGLGS